MTSLIVCLGVGKGTWAYVSKLIEAEPWNKVFIVTDEAGLSYTANREISFVVIKEEQFLSEMIETIKKQLDGKIPDTEAAVNFVSGTGKVHMAILSALLKIGLGIRLVAMTPEGMKEV
ncbi:MAG: hypothetical protein AABX51_05550 [Nanoarchaeota archaeon]